MIRQAQHFCGEELSNYSVRGEAEQCWLCEWSSKLDTAQNNVCVVIDVMHAVTHSQI